MAHDLLCKVLFALIHGSHNFVFLYFNSKGISNEKDDPFLYKLEFFFDNHN